MKKFLSAAVLLFFPAVLYSASDLGLFGGYSSVQGEYRNELSSAGRFGIYYLPFIADYLQVECDATYAGYSLRNNRSSMLHTAGFGVIPQAKISFLNSFSLFAGPGFGCEYLYLNGERSGRQVKSFKPVFLADAGLNWQFTEWLGARVWGMYSVKKLSGITFTSVDICFGVSRSFGDESAPVSLLADEKTLLAEGFIQLNRKNLRKAQEEFSEVLEYYAGSAEAKTQLEKIRQIMDRFDDAEKMIKSGDQFGALGVLETIKDSFDEAQSRYVGLKADLMSMKEGMKREGIAAYNSGDYEKSFDILSKLMKISPEDKEIDAYLQRAKRKIEALNKLR